MDWVHSIRPKPNRPKLVQSYRTIPYNFTKTTSNPSPNSNRLLQKCEDEFKSPNNIILLDAEIFSFGLMDFGLLGFGLMGAPKRSVSMSKSIYTVSRNPRSCISLLQCYQDIWAYIQRILREYNKQHKILNKNLLYRIQHNDNRPWQQSKKHKE